MDPKIQAAVDALKTAGNVAVLTGAGISVESGIPPFRGKGGLWEKMDPMEVAHIDSFRRDPKRVWQLLIRDMKEVLDRAQPNDAHLGLARMEAMGLVRTVITQNVDGLHQAAGSTEVVEFHGSFAWQRCMACDGRVETVKLDMRSLPPLCKCGGIYRPDCIFFGEMIPPDALSRSQAAAASCDVMMVIGTSATVQPAAYMPMIARQNGATIIEINREPTPLTASVGSILIMGRAGEIMRQIVSALETHA